MIVAIDGPAAAGKGTVARALAARLGWSYLDTGAMYRAIALAALERGIRPDEPNEVARVARSVRLELPGERVLLDGTDVTEAIRGPDVTRAVSSVAAHSDVRAVLVACQRELIASHRDVVMEGRDIGTAVAPEAEVKIFLTASLPERARRRSSQLGLAENDVTLLEIEGDLAARDDADAARSASPFRKADDAIEVDTTGRAVPEIVDEIAAIVERAGRDVDA